MIYEFRTYDLFPGNLPKYEETLTDSLAGGRLDHSDLFAYFYTEFGPLNQALHIWPYESLDARQAIREETTGITG
ncbi:MAG: NIPSNAP family protein, partial [Chloroflexi bacterium]|nr:NIPSNAP family protein [Chloroflexota bacterium]